MTRSRRHGWYVFWSTLGAAVVTGCFGLIDTYFTHWMLGAEQPAPSQQVASESPTAAQEAAAVDDEAQDEDDPSEQAKTGVGTLKIPAAALKHIDPKLRKFNPKFRPSDANIDPKARQLKGLDALRAAGRSTERKSQ